MDAVIALAAVRENLRPAFNTASLRCRSRLASLAVWHRALRTL